MNNTDSDLISEQTPAGLMWIRREFDYELMRDRFTAHDVQPEVTFAQELLDEADGEHLIYDGETITINVDNGKWIWQVVQVNAAERTVLGRWPD